MCVIVGYLACDQGPACATRSSATRGTGVHAQSYTSSSSTQH